MARVKKYFALRREGTNLFLLNGGEDHEFSGFDLAEAFITHDASEAEKMSKRVGCATIVQPLEVSLMPASQAARH